MSALDSLCINVQNRAWRAKERIKDFLAAQDGVSNVVATIIILLIVVLIIGIFWSSLKKWINGMMKTIFDTKIDASGLDDGL